MSSAPAPIPGPTDRRAVPAVEEGSLVEPGLLAITGAMILPSPDAPPIERGTVLVRGDRIVGLGPDLSVPSAAQVVAGDGRVVTAGFWNCHVHFTQEKWRRALHKSPSLVEAVFHDMLTSRGFTTVVDTGSDPRVTLALRGRVEHEGLLGPSIYTAGSSIFPPRGIPYYLDDSLSFWVRPFVPTPRTAWAVRGIVRRNLDRGADLVKLFTGSYVERGVVRTMPEAVARAAVEAAHARGKLVFSHPSNLEGTRVAVRAGVDVLAHPPDTTVGVDEAILREMVDRRMAMIPTLKMFARSVSEDRAYLEPIYRLVRTFRERGGQLLFGTDVGYMTDYATEEEFRALTACGLDAREVLRSLTTAPAERFGVAGSVGTVSVGARADLTLLDADPNDHPLAFTRVRATIRRGRVLHLRP